MIKMEDNIFYTGIVVVNSDKNEVLLGKRSCDGIWTSPGGTSEADEFPQETAIRELKEEANIDIDEFLLNKLNVQTAHDGNQVFVYYININPKEFNISSKQDPDEEVPKWQWFSFDNLPKGLMKDEERFLSVISAIQETLKMKEDINVLEESLKGGEGDKAKPEDFDKEQIRMGLEIEMEHTNDKEVAMEIVLDHLSEDKSYYSKLNKIIVDPVKEKMELKEEIKELEKKMESMDKSKNPIEANPANDETKRVKLDEPNVPEDKKNKDKLVDKGDHFVKEELSNTINRFNEVLSQDTMTEKKVYIDNPFEAPAGADVKQGAKGGWYYDSESGQSAQTGDKPKTKDIKKKIGSKGKDLAKTK